MAKLNGTRQNGTAGVRWPDNALTNAFVRNVAKAGRYCDGHRAQRVSCSRLETY